MGASGFPSNPSINTASRHNLKAVSTTRKNHLKLDVFTRSSLIFGDDCCVIPYCENADCHYYARNVYPSLCTSMEGNSNYTRYNYYGFTASLTDFRNCDDLTDVGNIPCGFMHFGQGFLYCEMAHEYHIKHLDTKTSQKSNSNQYINIPVCMASVIWPCGKPADVDAHTGSFAILRISATSVACVHYSGLAPVNMDRSKLKLILIFFKYV